MMMVADMTRHAPAGTPCCEQYGTIVMRPFQFPRLQLVIWLISGLVSLPSDATIIADSHAPAEQQPTILSTANGRPQINIQTPNEHGVSRNQYQQFDVDSRGAILNNSHNVTQTELAGQIIGNPRLAKQEARIIVNEVNSKTPSPYDPPCPHKSCIWVLITVQ